ncbi:hypothetical protein F2P47_03530 [Parvibaculum sedimenti]|uniref:Uncharacterized protein n=1 Tax=Parvibaculum sedimenti TaxID=2608632 RepID=A0A6N6VLP2_9HYPH|nr:hypothetical protein [Parvibaculum sedimenti]KAB7742346.1 hypothetical protein F2P47_03530 [Parvibaculum sedimenti]
MTDFTSIAAHPVQGKHNMASDAFDALKASRAQTSTQKTSGLTFGDVLDTLNPLQHIPVVSSIYRELTGDTISPGARVAGGALYGGPIGLVASVFDAAVEAVSGSDLGEHAIATLTGDKGAEPKTVASAAPVPETVPTRVARAEPQPAQPVKLAEVTTSVPKPMPQLSPDAFNALLNSFADPKAAKAANPELAAAAEPAARNATAKTEDPPHKPADLSGAIASGLDQLDALKHAQPDIPLAASFAGPEASGL